MKILHISGFSDEERKEKAGEIRENIFESIKVGVFKYGKPESL